MELRQEILSRGFSESPKNVFSKNFGGKAKSFISELGLAENPKEKNFEGDVEIILKLDSKTQEPWGAEYEISGLKKDQCNPADTIWWVGNFGG